MLLGKRIGVSQAIFLAVAFVMAMVLIPANRTVLARHRDSSGSDRARVLASSHPSASSGRKANLSAIRSSYGAVPLSFEPNVGQAGPSIDFVSHGPNYTLLLSGNRAMIDLEQERVIANDPTLSKMDAKTLRKFEASKYFRVSSRFRKAKKSLRVEIRLPGANTGTKAMALDELPGKSNYFVGNDRRKWRAGVPNYRRIRYSSIYPGIDLVYYGSRHQLEFDFVVAPNADPSSIALTFDPSQRVRIARDGALEFGTRRDGISLGRPSIYQIDGQRKRLVQGGFVLRNDGTIGIDVAAYDKGKPLIIDPVLAYSTYLGGNNVNYGEDIAVDSTGAAYIGGTTLSTNFPLANNYSSTSNSNGMAFVAKLDPTGSTLLYSTYVGGTGETWGSSIAIDQSQNVYIGGQTFSTDFPIVNGFQASNNNTAGNGNGFLARIDTTQTGTASLVYSSYLGGGGNSTNQWIGDEVIGLATDGYGLAYLTGQTTSDSSVTAFPTTSTALQGSLASTNGSAFLTVLDTNQSGAASLIYSTYLGGDSAGPLQFGDYGLGVAVDTQGDAYLTGQTSSDASGPFPVTSGAYQSSLNSADGNAFVTEISTTQSGAQSLVYSTYFGGSTASFLGDWGEAITLDASGKVYVTGDASTSDFPTTSGAFQTTNSPEGKAFAAKFDLSQSGTQSLVYATFLGGSNGDEGENGMDVAVDPSGDAFIAGETSSSDFPTTSDALSTTPGSDNWHGFLAHLNPGGTGLLYSTYLGGSCTTGLGDGAEGVALDSLSNAYVTGYTCSSDFPITSQAYQTSLAGSTNAFVTKLALNANPGVAASPSPRPNASGWNNSAVVVSFTCIPGSAPIQSCTSPTTVSTEGASQVVTGTATDTASNTATTSDTVNLDLTAPTLAITSPANNSTVSTSYAVVTGTLMDSLSGPGSVFCNSVPAALTGTNFLCTLQLSSVSNSIVVTGYDVAGNTASTTLTVGVSMPTPTSLTISPASPNMIVGGTQAFTAIDQTGTTRPDATWSVSDTTIASFESNSPNTLVGNAAGTATVTATIGSVTGQTTVTVLAGSSLSIGTVLWTAPSVSGFTAQQIVQAVPTANGPDLYSIDVDSSGDTLVQALTADGRQLWQSPVLEGFSGVGVGDNSGGVMLTGAGASGPEMIDLNPQTGGQNWQYSPSLVSGVNSYLNTPVALGLDGTTFVTEENCAYSYTPTEDGAVTTDEDCLNGINGSTGALASQVTLPTSYSLESVGQFCDVAAYTDVSNPPGNYSPPMVAPDGSVYMEAITYQSTSTLTCDSSGETSSGSWSQSVYLLRNGAPVQTLNSSSSGDDAFFTPGDVIPDGNGGVLAAYFNEDPYELVIADTISGAQVTFSNLLSYGTMVLGDNNTAFVTDGTNVVSFKVSNLQQNWIYTSASGGNVTFVAATSGGGVTINDSQLGVIQLDSSGTASTPAASLQGTNPFRPGLPSYVSQDGTTVLGDWLDISGGLSASLAGPNLAIAPVVYPESWGGATNGRTPVGTVTAITVHFSGSRSSDDKVNFPDNQSCTQETPFFLALNDLGLRNCQNIGKWTHNVEFSATVSDDASNWLPKQFVWSYRTGYWKDELNRLNFFAVYQKATDGPDLKYVQALRGQKSVFFLDSPGEWYYKDHPYGTEEPIDSVNLIQNFNSALCNRGNICWGVPWFNTLVVTPGDSLSYTGSPAGFGWHQF